MSQRSRNTLAFGTEAIAHGISSLKLLELENIQADAPDVPANRKRKAPRVPRAHWGLPSDSAERLSLIAFSRLVRSLDLLTLNQVASSPVGVAVLTALKGVVLRVAVANGGAEINAISVATLFNLSGSSFASQSRYDGSSLSLPDKLPYAGARALVRSMLDSLTVALLVSEGTIVPRLLLRIPFAPLNAEAQAAIDVLMARVEADLAERLVSGGRGGSSSSGSSSMPPPPPPPPPPDVASLQPAFSVDVSASLAQNAVRVVQVRLGRSLSAAENAAILNALAEALSVLTTGDETARQAKLSESFPIALASPSSAQLWASVLEALQAVSGGGEAGSEVARVADAINEAVSTVVGAQMTSVFGL